MAAQSCSATSRGDRFWTFQTIESGILLAMTVVLLGLAIYWVTRRVT